MEGGGCVSDSGTWGPPDSSLCLWHLWHLLRYKYNPGGIYPTPSPPLAQRPGETGGDLGVPLNASPFPSAGSACWWERPRLTPASQECCRVVLSTSVPGAPAGYTAHPLNLTVKVTALGRRGSSESAWGWDCSLGAGRAAPGARGGACPARWPRAVPALWRAGAQLRGAAVQRLPVALIPRSQSSPAQGGRA